MTADSQRPHYHFTPPTAWMNDPNGMLYHEGEYHIFYQYHPDSLVWGPMHWGHAISRDLVTWEHLPIALYPDPLGMIFSGSAVVDSANTAGFGAGAMVAIFTHHGEAGEFQSIAYSHDNGRTWQKYEGNPVLPRPADAHDFRDPKVFWYESEQGAGYWVMVLAVANRIHFYTSPDLKTWTHSGQFGPGYGSGAGVWETPELFPLVVEGESEKRWVLIVAVGDGAPAGGSGTQYFIGDFDGTTFTTAAPPDQILWADYGADFYAPQLWNHLPNGRRMGVAWFSNWQYARETPTVDYRGAFTIPREFSLVATPNGIRLVQRPATEIEALRGMAQQWHNLSLANTPWQTSLPSNTVELIAEWEIPAATTAETLTLALQWGDAAEVTITYDCGSRILSVDRSKGSTVAFNPHFAAQHHAQAPLDADTLRLHLFLDTQMLELFANDGLATFTEQIFPPAFAPTLSLRVANNNIVLKTLTIYPLGTAVDS